MSPEADLQPTQGVQTTNLEGSNELPDLAKNQKKIFFLPLK